MVHLSYLIGMAKVCPVRGMRFFLKL